MASRSGPTVAFCETTIQVQHVLDSGLWQGEVDEIVALRPEVASELQKSSIPYFKMEDFYDENRLCDWGQPALCLFAEWMTWVDGFVQSIDQELWESDFRPIHLHFHFIKMFVDELALHAFAARQFFERHHPGKVVFFPHTWREPTEDMFFRESPISIVLPIIAGEYGAEAKVLRLGDGRHNRRYSARPEDSKASKQQQLAASRWLSLRRLLIRQLSAPLIDNLLALRDSGFREYFGSVVRKSHVNGHVVVLRRGYDVESLISVLRRRGLQVDIWQAPSSGPALIPSRQTMPDSERWGNLWEAVSQEDRFWKLFADLGIGSLRPFVERSLSSWWKTTLPSAWTCFVQAGRYFEASRPDAIITPLVWSHRDTAVMAAAKSRGIRRIIYQHGGFVGSNDYWGGWEYVDFLNADHYLMYGTGMKSYFLERATKYGTPITEFHVVGSAKLDRIRESRISKRVKSLGRKIESGKTRPNILYITDMIMGYQRGLRLCTYPAVRYYEFLQRVVNTFRDFRDVRLLFKGIPGTDKFFNPIPEMILKELPEALIVADQSLTDLMWSADAIVVDHEGGALWEILLTRKPILLYADKRSLRIRPEAKKLLERRVQFSDEESDFFRKLRGFLGAGDFSELGEADDDFLKTYGTFLNDGLSVERAADTIMSVACCSER